MQLLRALPLALLAACAPARASSPAAAELAVTHVTVIDGTGAAPRSNQTVLIGGGRILRIAGSGRTAVPAGARIIDGSGKFMIPGLWDMHVHAWNRQPFEGISLSHGITGIREMGTGVDPQWGGEGVWRWREMIRAGDAPGPRMVAAGFILNGGAPDAQPIDFFKGVPTPEAARAWVDSLAGRGADFIKVYAALSPEAYAAIAARAREHGLPFAGHVPARVGIRGASGAGQRGIEHLYDVLVATSTDEDAARAEIAAALASGESPGAAAQLAEIRLTDRLIATHDARKEDALYRLLRRNGTWITPTLTTQADPRCPGSPLPLPDSASLAGVPRMLHAMVALPAAPADEVARKCRRFDALVRVAGRMHRAGIPLLAGSDAPNPGVVPGVGLHQELELLVRAGLTPMEVLQAATRDPARFLGMEDSLGTVEQGKLADLVILDADPLADIRNTRRIHAVIANGRVVHGPGAGN
ncbi:MAG TPA: amidohydrolase family protein [Longimicrobium sp.]|nr:amidohydrolase family protein [Longimicrobium sp.]